MIHMNFTIEENINLAPFCSMKAGGNSKYLVVPKNENELIDAVRYFNDKNDK